VAEYRRRPVLRQELKGKEEEEQTTEYNKYSELSYLFRNFFVSILQLYQKMNENDKFGKRRIICLNTTPVLFSYSPRADTCLFA